MDLLKTIVLSLLQGVTELFPISSLGHTVILPGLLGWGDIMQNNSCGGENCFLPTIVAFHLGTCLALIVYFWRDWLQVGKTLVVTAKQRGVKRGSEEWVSWLVIIGTIPAGLLGLILKKPLESLFESPIIAAIFLIVNGSLLFLGEALRRRSEARWKATSAEEREAQFRPLQSLSWKEAIVVGLGQSLALIPGLSRSGSTMVAGLAIRMKHEDAARFSFLLGTPIILAASLLEVPKLRHLNLSGGLGMILFGVALSGIAAFLSTRFLMKYFEKGRLDPFAYYCWIAGLLSLVLLLTLHH
jgi:undecaprenyl-diphosphatase